jgi:phosphatidylserine decarboxylase
LIAQQGHKLLRLVFLLVILLLIGGYYLKLPVVPVLFWIVFVFLLFGLWFFRDPERDTPAGQDLIISPADGRVVEICPVEDDFVGKAQRISIFMSLFNVHVNRVPVSGIVQSIQYSKGRFLPAMRAETSIENERNAICLENSKIRIKFTQIAGLIARRIICRLEQSQKVAAGQRFGLIVFGSRVDLVVPESVTLQVKLQSKVTAGETVIGEIS